MAGLDSVVSSRMPSCGSYRTLRAKKTVRANPDTTPNLQIAESYDVTDRVVAENVAMIAMFRQEPSTIRAVNRATRIKAIREKDIPIEINALSRCDAHRKQRLIRSRCAEEISRR
jgi:hypothetical protein